MNAERILDRWLAVVFAPMIFADGRGLSVAARISCLVAYFLWFFITLPISGLMLAVCVPIIAIQDMK